MMMTVVITLINAALLEQLSAQPYDMLYYRLSINTQLLARVDHLMKVCLFILSNSFVINVGVYNIHGSFFTGPPHIMT